MNNLTPNHPVLTPFRTQIDKKCSFLALLIHHDFQTKNLIYKPLLSHQREIRLLDDQAIRQWATGLRLSGYQGRFF
jgi:hypothetical protein